MITVLYILLGLCAGTLSGLVGIGGGIIIVPALVYFFGFSQHQAQGTTLALMVPPIGILGALTYYKQGYFDLKTAALICLGFLIGSLLGAKVAIGIPDHLLRKIFGGVLFAVSFKMLLGK